MHSKEIDLLSVDWNLVNRACEQIRNESISIAQSAFRIRTYEPFEILSAIDWNSLHRALERDRARMASLICFALQRIQLKSKPSKNSIDARFAARFGTPPCVQLQKMRLNRHEQQERRGKIFAAYRAALNSILERQATEGEIFGYREIPEAKEFVCSEK